MSNVIDKLTAASAELARRCSRLSDAERAELAELEKSVDARADGTTGFDRLSDADLLKLESLLKKASGE